MRLFRLIASLCLTIAACVAAAPAANADVVDTFRFESGIFRVNTCNGQFVTTSGILTVTTRSGGGELTAYITGHFKGTGGTGTEYVANLSEQVDQVFGPVPTFHQEARTVLVSKGSEPNLTFLAVFDLDANGNATFTSQSICHG